MTTKSWKLISVAVLLGGFSLYLNKDWFSGDPIQLMHRSRPARGAFRRVGPDNPLIDPISFWFDRKVRLKSLKVVPVSDLQTNQNAPPLWCLISDSNSLPVKEFPYGGRIAGMHPLPKGTPPDPLEPGVKYRLMVEAGNEKITHDFTPEPRTE
jgi:hypothetical protein